MTTLQTPTAELGDLISGIGISVAEYSVLNCIHFGHRDSKHRLARRAASPDYSLGTSLELAESTQAVRSCFHRGFLRVITDHDLLEIRNDLERDHVIGPIYGLPELGKVEFTKAGAALWLAIKDATPDDRPWPFRRGFAYCDVVEIRTHRFFATRRAAAYQRSSLRQEVTTRPTACPGLRFGWWCPPMRGWQFDSIERMMWAGRSGGGNPFLFWDGKQAGIDRAQLRRACHRHGMDLSDWCVLLTVVSWGAHRERDICCFSTAFAEREFGLRNAAERIDAAIHRCAGKRLIVRLGTDAARHVEAAVASSTRPMILPNLDPECTDLSAAGVELMFDLGPKVFGDAWNDGWQLQREVFRREHRYAQTLLDVASVFEEYNSNPESALSIGAITQLGPWCAYWWETHPAGYRIELEIGSEQPAGDS